MNLRRGKLLVYFREIPGARLPKAFTYDAPAEWPSQIEAIWRYAMLNGEKPIDMAGAVWCDDCGKKYHDSGNCGGLIVYGSIKRGPNLARAVGPCCWSWQYAAQRDAPYGHLTCPNNVAFLDFVMEYRTKQNRTAIRVTRRRRWAPR